VLNPSLSDVVGDEIRGLLLVLFLFKESDLVIYMVNTGINT
jgi:hypothetical protein